MPDFTAVERDRWRAVMVDGDGTYLGDFEASGQASIKFTRWLPTQAGSDFSSNVLPVKIRLLLR